MRVLDINDLYSPNGGRIRAYHDRKLQWVRQSADHTAALVYPSNRFHRERFGNIFRYEVPSVPVPGAGFRLVLSAAHLRRVIDDFRPDLIELGSPWVLPSLLRRALGDRRVPTVGFYHVDYPDTAIQPLARRLPDLLGGGMPDSARRHAGAAYGALTATFAPSDHVLRKLHQYGVRRLFKTPLGVDPSVFRPEARRAEFRTGLGILSDQILISFVGPLVPAKGIEMLLNAWPRVTRRGQHILLVAGHGPMHDRIEVLTMSEPSVRRLPFLRTPAEVATLMATSDVVVLPGGTETFSLTALEALACGTPVLAPDTGGAGELARLAELAPFATGDARALAAAIDAALPRDRIRAAELHRRIAAGWSWDAAFSRQFDCYARIAAAFAANDLTGLAPQDGLWNDVTAP